MASKNLFTGLILLLVSVYLLNTHVRFVRAAVAGTANNVEAPHRTRSSRPFVRSGAQYARIKPANTGFGEFLVDDDDLFELSKRQASDDYGHLRFGKRGEEVFDDYGHMRFGRSGGGDN